MSDDTHVPMEQMDFFKGYVEIADWAWTIVSNWSPLAQSTVGKQMIKALDSVGANLVEGDGRHSGPDALHFFVIARASAREGRYWIERARTRGLVPHEEANARLEQLASATRRLNALIKYRRSRNKSGDRVRESTGRYDLDTDPFSELLDD